MFASDSHGDLRDKRACSALFEFCKDFKPTIRICGGDHFDFRWLRKSADKDEKDAAITEDVNCGIEFIHAYRPTHFLTGNHDQRIVDLLDSSTGFLSELAHRVWGDIKRALGDVPIYPYDKKHGALRIGDHTFIHGYSAGVNALRKAALSYGNVVQGHVHRTDMMTVERIEPVRGYSAGCLCATSLPYNRAQLGTLAQTQGWAYGVMTNNKVKIWLAELFEGQWLAPSEIRGYG